MFVDEIYRGGHVPCLGLLACLGYAHTPMSSPREPSAYMNFDHGNPKTPNSSVSVNISYIICYKSKAWRMYIQGYMYAFIGPVPMLQIKFDKL